MAYNFLIKIFITLIIIFFTGCSTTKLLSTNTRDVLSDTKYSKILLEVMSFDKLTRPERTDLEFLKSKILKYCHKDIVEYKIDKPIPIEYLSTLLWTTDNLRCVEFQNYRYTSGGDTLVIHILYVPGLLTDDTTTCGLTYDSYSFVIFCGADGTKKYKSTLLHEFGHIMMLVDSESPNHDDSYRFHCTNKNCVMFWRSCIGQDPDFDGDCRDQIRANGGK